MDWTFRGTPWKLITTEPSQWINTLYLYLCEVFRIETISDMSHPFYALNVFRVTLLFRLPEDRNVKQHHIYERDNQHKWH